MKKLLITLILLFIGLQFNYCFAKIDKTEISTIPEYQEYFDEYSKRLYENFHPEKHFFGVWGTFDVFTYTIFRDGTVKNIIKDFYNNRYTDYCKIIIMETEAKPFPDAIKDDFIVMDVTLGYYNEDKFSMHLYGRTDSYLWLYRQNRYNVESVNVVSIQAERKNYWNKIFNH